MFYINPSFTSVNIYGSVLYSLDGKIYSNCTENFFTSKSEYRQVNELGILLYHRVAFELAVRKD